MQTFIVNLFKTIPVKYRFASLVVMAFVAAIAFFSINSYHADKWGVNWLCWVVGIVLSVVVVAVIKEGLEENK